VATRSTPLAIGTIGSSGDLILHTVPSGYTTIVQWIAVGTSAATPTSLSFYVVGPALAAVGAVEAVAGGRGQTDVWWAMWPGWQLRAINYSAVSISFLVSGTVLPGVAADVDLVVSSRELPGAHPGGLPAR